MDNPFTGKPVGEEAAAYIETVKTARRNARKAARSGNPAISGPARVIVRTAPRMVATVYRTEVGR
jgi:hypothetical protein